MASSCLLSEWLKKKRVARAGWISKTTMLTMPRKWSSRNSLASSRPSNSSVMVKSMKAMRRSKMKLRLNRQN
ncbi:hypothetical protein D3C75_716300 [compost metagenome]